MRVALKAKLAATFAVVVASEARELAGRQQAAAAEISALRGSKIGHRRSAAMARTPHMLRKPAKAANNGGFDHDLEAGRDVRHAEFTRSAA